MRGRGRGNRLPRPLERDVQRGAIKLLDFHGFHAFRRNTGVMSAEHKGKRRWIRFSDPGASDLWAIQRSTGLHLEVEVKRPRERPSLDQVEWLLKLNDLGTVAFWVDNLDTLDRVLSAIATGYRVVYLPTRRIYEVRDPNFGWVKQEGPSGDFDLIKRTPGGYSRCHPNC